MRNRLPVLSVFAIAMALAGCVTANTGAPALADSRWRVVTIDGTPPASDQAMLSFSGDRLSASAGCNRMAGTWTIEGEQLVTGPIAATRMFCEGRMEQEAALSALLSGKPALSVSGDKLSLRTTAHVAELQRIR